MKMSRRQFLLRAAAFGAGWALPALQFAARAQSANDYKALVCVFLYGGNDSANTVIPAQSGEYDQYLAMRKGLAIAPDQLVRLFSNGAARFGLHPQFGAMAPLWDAGRLAILFNVGTLVQPMTRDEYLTYRHLRPLNLLSHDDQQRQWQSARYLDDPDAGWGGLMAETVMASGAGSTLPVGISVAGNDIFLAGKVSPSFAIPATGRVGLEGGGEAPQFDQARFVAMQQLLAAAGNGAAHLTRVAADQMSRGIAGAQALEALVNQASGAVQAAFAGTSSSISNQLLRVAQIIEGRGAAAASRQIFFVSHGNYDTHDHQLERHAALLRDLGAALGAFQNAMNAIGAAEAVTTFTLSDFGRTLKPANGGSDHGWGGHHFIFGGAVRGGQTYGSFPSLVPDSPEHMDADGRFIPTISVDQYGATLANWFGVPPEAMPRIFPNLERFVTRNLGFMGP